MIEIQPISKKVNFLAHITKKSIGTGMDGLKWGCQDSVGFYLLTGPLWMAGVIASGIPKLMMKDRVFPNNTGRKGPRKFSFCLGYACEPNTIEGRSTLSGQLGIFISLSFENMSLLWFTTRISKNDWEVVPRRKRFWKSSYPLNLLSLPLVSNQLPGSPPLLYLFVQPCLSNSTAINLVRDCIINLLTNPLATISLSNLSCTQISTLLTYVKVIPLLKAIPVAGVIDSLAWHSRFSYSTKRIKNDNSNSLAPSSDATICNILCHSLLVFASIFLNEYVYKYCYLLTHGPSSFWLWIYLT